MPDRSIVARKSADERPQGLASGSFGTARWLRESRRLPRLTRCFLTDETGCLFRYMPHHARRYLVLPVPVHGVLRDAATIGHGSTPGSSRVTRAGWLGSSWRQPASPQRASLGSGGVALRASTPATPEL